MDPPVPPGSPDETHTAPPDVADPDSGLVAAAPEAPPPVETVAPAPKAPPVEDDGIIDAEIVPPPILVPPSPVTPQFDYTDAGVPTLSYLQDKLDQRFGTALGATELAGGDRVAEDAAKRDEERAKAAQAKLDEIRRSLHPEG